MSVISDVGAVKLEPRIKPPLMQYCTRCTYPRVSASPLTFDEEGLCSGCRVHDEQKDIDWDARKALWRKLLHGYRSDGTNYDCIIPVSGGKDSFYQIHLLKVVHKMNPLLVTYGENNYMDVGMRNIKRMRDVFGCDHIFFQPSVDVLKKLNRVGFLKMGDPDMHAHMGIMSYPFIIAVKFNIPLIIFGEHGFMNLSGMHSYNDFVEYTAKMRKEHVLRGYDWYDFVGEEGLEEKDFLWGKYPDDDEIERVGVRGVYVANYFGWNQHVQTQEMVETYGFEFNPIPFDRTYARESNLNNFHDNGVHDYMKYIKFGYGRVTDHVCRDIRDGVMTRDDGIEMVRQYDHVVPGDIARWLDYVGMTRTEFEHIADTFRDPRVWTKNEYGQWIKDNVWEHN